MDHGTLNSKSVLEALLKTNRPPTDHEKAIIQESMAPTNAKLKAVKAQISVTMAHIQALKDQVEQAETKLQRLREEEAAMLGTFADHRRVFSPFRNLPEDILREICIACVEGDIPKRSRYYGIIPLPYVLAQICIGMRHIALTTPCIWASMEIETGPFYCDTPGEYEKVYSILARKVRAWFERAGGLALTVFIHEDPGSTYASVVGSESDPSSILFDSLLSYSTRWKYFQLNSRCELESTALTRIFALTAFDVPLLQSVSIRLEYLHSNPVLGDKVFLTIPTLKHVKLVTNSVQMFTVNWAVLTSVTLRGPWHYRHCYFRNEIARILQQTKCLVFCDVVVGMSHPEEHYVDQINLPFLKTLFVDEESFETSSSAAPSILDLITAPLLEIFHIREAFLDLSLSEFFKRSPHIWSLSLPYLDSDKSLTDTIGYLHLCPSLTVLSLWPGRWNKMVPIHVDRLMRAFVEEGDSGVVCPRLQHFDFKGPVDFSLQTLHIFLEGKQGEIAIPDVLPWKMVVIDIGGIETAGTRQQMLDFVSQKNAAGLDVEVRESRY